MGSLWSSIARNRIGEEEEEREEAERERPSEREWRRRLRRRGREWFGDGEGDGGEGESKDVEVPGDEREESHSESESQRRDGSPGILTGREDPEEEEGGLLSRDRAIVGIRVGVLLYSRDEEWMEARCRCEGEGEGVGVLRKGRISSAGAEEGSTWTCGDRVSIRYLENRNGSRQLESARIASFLRGLLAPIIS